MNSLAAGAFDEGSIQRSAPMQCNAGPIHQWDISRTLHATAWKRLHHTTDLVAELDRNARDADQSTGQHGIEALHAHGVVKAGLGQLC